MEFNQTEYPTSESDGQVTLTVVADKPASFEYTVTVTTADITATGQSLFNEISHTTNFKLANVSTCMLCTILYNHDNTVHTYICMYFMLATYA